MTRINTNVSSLLARNVLDRTNAELQTALTRLSTGLRINSGQDDPAGLIASEILRSDIVSVQKAISNSERANGVIATTEAALDQVSSLLNDVRGLITESANTGAVSDDEISANQLQLDSALEALNRISATSEFQGRRLLDGSLDFNYTEGSNFSSVTDINIDQANLGATGSVQVNVQITTAATQAVVTNGSGFSAATAANAQLTFAPEVFFDNTNFATNAELFVQSRTTGTNLEGVTVQVLGQTGLGAGNETAVYDDVAGTLTLTVDDTAATTAGNLVDAINNQVAEFFATSNGNDAEAVAATEATGLAPTATVADFLTITAANNGPDFNNVDIDVIADGSVTPTTPTVSYDSTTKRLEIRVDTGADTTLANIVAAFALEADFTAVASATAADETLNVSAGTLADYDATANTGTTGGGVLLDDLSFVLGGSASSEVFTFESGVDITQVVAGINLVSDATNVTAAASGIQLTLTSSDYGSNAFVDVDVVSEGSAGTFKAGLSALRDEGTDIVAAINGISADGDGNTFAINTATLDVKLSVTPGSTTDFDFTITGGGALFQIGPDVVTNQQARIGITSVNTGKLGGVAGRLFQLGSGQNADLETDPALASSIVEEAINQVTSLRGRLGAFQKTTLETNINALNDALINLTEAESQIRDADFAAETASLTRAQILVQSGTSVLAIANSQPQNVLALLR